MVGVAVGVCSWVRDGAGVPVSSGVGVPAVSVLVGVVRGVCVAVLDRCGVGRGVVTLVEGVCAAAVLAIVGGRTWR